MTERDELYRAIEEALDDLFTGTFMLIQDYAASVAEEKMVKKGKWDDDYKFQQENPDHPLTSDNRGKRIVAADSIRDLTMDWQLPLPDDLLERIHTALFDCCAAVRHSLAHALFYCGSEQSAHFLEKLLEEETESKIVCKYTTAALQRCRMRSLDQLPEGKKVIMLVSKDIQLYMALQKIAELEGAYLYMPQHNYSELIAWSSAAAVQIVDRILMGQDNWNAFCDYLDDVNQTGVEYPVRDESGEVLFEEPLYDHTPLIIIDANLSLTRQKLRNANKPIGKTFGVEGGSIDLMEKLVTHFLQGKEVDFAALVNECNEGR